MLCIYFLLILCINGYTLPWSWDTIPLWADFGINNVSLITDYQSQFVATHYDIISLEKCLGEPWNTHIPTEQSFYKIASNIRQYASSNETKIVFYWNIAICYCDCYNITQYVLQNKSMWFLDDYGNPIYAGNDKNRPTYDITQQYVRDWWVNSLVTIITDALNQNIIIDGVFADGTCNSFGPNVSNERTAEYNNAITLLMDETKKAFQNVNNDLFILGNGLISYGFEPDHCLHIVPYIDGVLVEHFGAFEEVEKDGSINATDLLMWYNITQSISNGNYGDDKSIFIKAWIGPETTPIDGMGPSWPPSYGLRPSTHEGIQNASSVLISFPLAVYLCGIYNKNVYFNYAWWYDIEQGYVPCPDNPETCDCPLNWYKEFTNNLGKPISNGIMSDTYKCNRSFEHANVYVNLEDDSSAQIQWL